MVIYIPDVWSAMPSCLEWDALQLNMKKQLDKKLIEAGKDQMEVTPDDEKASDYFFILSIKIFYFLSGVFRSTPVYVGIEIFLFNWFVCYDADLRNSFFLYIFFLLTL